jgi:hypothetical protein
MFSLPIGAAAQRSSEEKMNVGPKTAGASWLAIVAIGISLLAFSWTDDSNAGLRDAEIELGLLREGPTQAFVDVCREFEKRRAKGIVVSPDQDSTREASAGELLGSTRELPLVSSDFKVSGLLWCPLPPKTTSVREALAVVGNLHSSSITLWPHSSFLRELGLAVARRRALREGDLKQYAKFDHLASDIAAGKVIASLAVVSDRGAGTHALFDCATTEAVFDFADTNKLPSFPVQLIVALREGGAYCLHERDVPAQVERLYGSGGFVSQGLYTSYFGNRISASVGYFKKSAAASGLRDIPKERQVPNEKGVVSINEWFGFDFPALRSQLKDLGSLSIDEAYIHLSSKLAASTDTAEVFGIKLPVRAFLATVGVSLPLLTLVFLTGLRHHGGGALPEALQGLPGPLLWFVILCGVCVLPAAGMFIASQRLPLMIPEVAPALPMLAACWLVGSATGLALVRRARRRTEP